MRKVILTAALLMPMAIFAQTNKDTVSYQAAELEVILHDLQDVYIWQIYDIENELHVCEYSHEILRAIIEDLETKLCEITD